MKFKIFISVLLTNKIIKVLTYERVPAAHTLRKINVDMKSTLRTFIFAGTSFFYSFVK